MKTLSESTAHLFRPLNLSPDDRMSVELDEEGKKFLCQLWRASEHAHEGRTYRSHGAGQFPWRVPERKRLHGTHETWAFAATDYTACLIKDLWPAEQLVVSEDAARVLNYLCLTVEAQMQNARRTAEWRQLRLEPSDEILDSENFPLAGYQRVGLHNSLHQEGYSLFMEQGTGKTPVVIARVCNEATELREGLLDTDAARQTASQIHAEYARMIAEERAEIDSNVERQIENKKTKLQNAAKRQAAKQTVKLDFEGTADMALVHARNAVRNVESWFGRRMVEINDEMRRLAGIFRAEAADLKSKREADLATIRDRKINAIVAPRRQPENRFYRVLVVAPKNVRMNWALEFEKFSTCDGRVTVLRGDEIKRAKQLVDAMTKNDNGDNPLYTVVICSYETLSRSWNLLQMIEWDLTVLDESHYVKNQGTKRWKYAKKLRSLSRQRMILTGTPITNTPLDLYTQLEFLGHGWSGFQSWANFRSFYGVYKSTEQGHNKLVDVQNMPFMQERLARMSFSVKKTEALPDLPEKLYDVHEVEMTPEQSQFYLDVRDKLVAEIERDLEKSTMNKQLVVNNILTKLLRLAQITSGFIVWDQEYDGETLGPREIDRLDPNPKIEALVEILKDKRPDQKTLVWACWVQDIKSIRSRLELEGIDCVTFYGGTSDEKRDEAVRRFNEDPDCKVLIGNATAGGVGLNLLGYPPGRPDDTETNCDHIVYFSQNWSPTARSQSEDRPHRRGTRCNVRVTDLCVPGTIDEEIRARVLKKRIVADEIGDVRSLLQNLLRGFSDE